MFFLPLVNVEKIKNILSRIFYSPIQGASIPEFACPICKQDPIQTPFVANCGHIFCYFCIKQNMMMDSKFDCPRCRTVVTEIKRFKMEEEKEPEEDVNSDQEYDTQEEE
jgi:peroxin-2